MNDRYVAGGFSGGRMKSSATAAGYGPNTSRTANGLVLSGVVVTTYVPVDGGSPFPDGVENAPTAVYCDVLTYGTAPGLQSALIHGALVVGGGMHNGHVWKPRAATMNVTGEPLDGNLADPRDLDGDHVLVQFLDNDLDRPVITARLPHPRTGQGTGTLPQAGHRQLLKVADGDPDLWKHNGSFYGLDKDGNFVLDTTRAHSGAYANDGAETPAEDATHGGANLFVSNKAKVTIVGVDTDRANEKYRCQLEDGKFTVQMAGSAQKSLVLDTSTGALTVKLGTDDKSLTLDGTSLTVKLGSATHELVLDQSAFAVKVGGDTVKAEGASAAAVLTVGDGIENAVSFSTFKAWANLVLTTMQSALAAHTHNATAPGAPTTPSSDWSVVFAGVKTTSDALIDTAKSNHVKIPLG